MMQSLNTQIVACNPLAPDEYGGRISTQSMASSRTREEEMRSAGRSLIKRLRRDQVSEVLSSRRFSMRPISLTMLRAMDKSLEGKTGRRSVRKREYRGIRWTGSISSSGRPI